MENRFTIYHHSAYTFYKHPEESGQMEISGEDKGNTPGELQAGVAQSLDGLDGLHHRRGDPASVRQDEGQEEVGVNLISQTAHLPGEGEGEVGRGERVTRRHLLEVKENGRGHDQSYQTQ